MMNRSCIRGAMLVSAMLVFGLALPSDLGAREAAAGAVQVTVKYGGKGAVDDSHRLWVWLFDSPNIGAGLIPIAEMSLDKNGGTATFDAVGASEVWIAVAYDVNGNFAGNAPPPSGSPVSTYGMAAGAPEAVTPGDKGTVALVFSDTVKMP